MGLGVCFIQHFLQDRPGFLLPDSLWAGGFLSNWLRDELKLRQPGGGLTANAAGVSVTGSLGFPLRCFGVALVRFTDRSSWVLCLDVGGLYVARSPRVSFQKRWLLGR